MVKTDSILLPQTDQSHVKKKYQANDRRDKSHFRVWFNPAKAAIAVGK
jgi:hypothetical protein